MQQAMGNAGMGPGALGGGALGGALGAPGATPGAPTAGAPGATAGAPGATPTPGMPPAPGAGWGSQGRWGWETTWNNMEDNLSHFKSFFLDSRWFYRFLYFPTCFSILSFSIMFIQTKGSRWSRSFTMNLRMMLFVRSQGCWDLSQLFQCASVASSSEDGSKCHGCCDAGQGGSHQAAFCYFPKISQTHQPSLAHFL